jgi:hypothetical protein
MLGGIAGIPAGAVAGIGAGAVEGVAGVERPPKVPRKAPNPNLLSLPARAGAVLPLDEAMRSRGESTSTALALRPAPTKTPPPGFGRYARAAGEGALRRLGHGTAAGAALGVGTGLLLGSNPNFAERASHEHNTSLPMIRDLLNDPAARQQLLQEMQGQQE